MIKKFKDKILKYDVVEAEGKVEQEPTCPCHCHCCGRNTDLKVNLIPNVRECEHCKPKTNIST